MLERRRFRLRVVRGPDRGCSRDFESGLVRVGAREACELVLTDAAVSGMHLEIRGTDRGFLLRDLGSTNGTRIDGVRVLEAFLPARARLGAGDTELRFELRDGLAEVPLHPEDCFGPVLGESPVMRALFADLDRIAASDATVLIQGETGTGKELVAEAIHQASPRARGPFVVVDCGALPATLIESELFGHERGAFTGATGAFRGAFERADGGSLLLDEVGELPLDLQPRLLRVLQRREVRRLGSETTRPVDVRVLAASNRILEREVNSGALREDLFYRLAVVRIEVPPLRERVGDVRLLARHLALEFGVVLEEADLAALERQAWPGNVRELRNEIERTALLGAVSRSPSGEDTPSDPRPAGAQTGAVDPEIPFHVAKAAHVEAFERRYAEAALERVGGNVAEAARRAGIDRRSFYRLLARLGMRPERP